MGGGQVDADLIIVSLWQGVDSYQARVRVVRAAFQNGPTRGRGPEDEGSEEGTWKGGFKSSEDRHRQGVAKGANQAPNIHFQE